jgi:hypothetical protein
MFQNWKRRPNRFVRGKLNGKCPSADRDRQISLATEERQNISDLGSGTLSVELLHTAMRYCETGEAIVVGCQSICVR